MTAKPWMKQPGEVVDRKGVPIYPGDLLRSDHFRDRRGKRYYLYHVAVYKDSALYMTPVAFLEPTKRTGGGECLLSDELAAVAEVLVGYGPDGTPHDERPRRKPATP